MKTYTYSFFAKIWYRYINIIVSIFLLLYAAVSLYLVAHKWYYGFISLLNFLIVFALNKHYIRSYKLFPFQVVRDKDGLTCTNFFLSKKNVRINYKDISEITGGIFIGWNSRPIYVYDKRNDIRIGFYAIGNFKDLLKNILQNIDENLYNELLDKMKAINNLK